MNSEYSIVTNNSVGSSLISGIAGSIEYLLVSDDLMCLFTFYKVVRVIWITVITVITH